jgi:membrane fusion protein (multidrug efflux system)
VRAKVDNSSGILLPGSYAEVEIVVDEKAQSVTIPTEAVVPDIAGELVYLYKNGKAIPSKIEIGLRTNTDVQILSGISVGDTVITSAIIQMRPGVDVSIKNFK